MTQIEEVGLREAGFKEEEIVDLRSIKEELRKMDKNIDRALLVAMTGLLYFTAAPVDVKIDGVKSYESTIGYRLTATSENGTHAPTALLVIKGESEDDEPVEIQYGIRLNDKDPSIIKVIESTRFDGNIDLFVPACLTFLKLTAYSFITERDEVEEEITRDKLIVGMPIVLLLAVIVVLINIFNTGDATKFKKE